MANADARRADQVQRELDNATSEVERLAIGRRLREATEMTSRRVASAGRTAGNQNSNPNGTLKN